MLRLPSIPTFVQRATATAALAIAVTASAQVVPFL